MAAEAKVSLVFARLRRNCQPSEWLLDVRGRDMRRKDRAHFSAQRRPACASCPVSERAPEVLRAEQDPRALS